MIAWGDNSYGQTDVPPGLTNVLTVAARDYHSLALKSDGTVVAWGDSSYGLTNVPPDLTNAIAIATGYYHSLALKSDATVSAWGGDVFGETHVPLGLTNVIAIAAGFYTSLALKSDGTIVGWGLNQTGELNIPPNLTNVIAIAAGLNTSWALTSDGTVVFWGSYSGLKYFMLSTVLGNMSAISATWDYMVALSGDGTVLNGPAGLNNVVVVAVGGPYHLALKTDGTLLEWGQTNAPAGLTNLIAIAAGHAHGLAIVRDGSVQFLRQLSTLTPYRGATATLNAAAVGTPPLSYQWLFNGSNLPGATNWYLTLTNVQPNLNGNYSVAVSNIHGALTSSNTTLMVITRPPIITDRSPDDQLALLGTNITLTVTATGPLPMTYQWQFNGTNIPGATDTSIGVSNFHVPNEGWYTVVVSNQFYGTSATMHLTAPDLPGALNARSLSWENRYFNRPWWYWQTAFTHDGIAAARSGRLGLGQSASSLSTTVSGPGTLSFWWAMAGAWDFDTLTFSINGVPQTIRYADRSYSWEQQTFYLADGTQDLQWTLTSGSSVNHSSKSGVLDQLVYTAGPTVPIITTTPVDQNIPATGNATFTVTAAGTPPLGYQWLFNGANIAGATNTSLTLTGIQAINAGTYSIAVINPYGSNTASAVLTVIPVPPQIVRQPVNQRAPISGNATFSVLVTGSEPFHYQWQFNGTGIAGATDSALTLTDVQMINGGNYQVLVTNDYGATNSSTAILTVARLIEWGFPRPIPVTLTNATAVSGGAYHCLALNPDGTVTAWGDNPNGQTSMPGGLSNVVAIASGLFHNLALKSDGTVVAWGAGTNVTGEPNYGQSRVPVGLINVAKIAAGGRHSLVLKSNGTVLAWGYNAYGQANVPAELSNVVAIAGGGFHCLALKNDGTVVAWGAGSNAFGRENYGQSKVPADLSNVVSVAAGGYHSLALKDNGTVVAWGNNSYGQTNVPAGLSNVVEIVAGGYHSLALRRDGTAIAWGYNGSGALRIPVGVVNVVALGAGLDYSLAIMNDGTPFILRQSPDRTIYSGMTVSFSVAAVGPSDLGYQWQFNGRDIVGATNAMLVLNNVALIDDGRYQCLVSNALGTVTSSPIALTVLRSRPRIGNSSSDLQLTSGGGFSLQVDGLSSDGNIVLFFSTNLVDWQPVVTNPPLTGSLKMMDTVETNFPFGFYEVMEE